MTRSLVLAVALLLLGCSNTPEWSKEGQKPEQVARALSDCQGMAREATARDTNIITDIMATRGNDWQRTGVMDTHVAAFQQEDRGRTEDIVNRCMISKGYVPSGK